MSKSILINDNLDMADDALLPFPRHFAECVANILTSDDNTEEECDRFDSGITFISSVGFMVKHPIHHRQTKN